MQLAQVQNPVATPLNPPGGTTGVQVLSTIIATTISVFIVAGIVFFVFFFLVGAIRWIMSSGDKATIEGARNQIFHALIGLVILFALFGVLKLLDILFGINLLQLDVGPLFRFAPR